MPVKDPLAELDPNESDANLLAADAEALDDEASRHKDRSVIGRWVVAMFLFVVVALIPYILIGPQVYGWESIRVPAEYASITIGSVLLPIVTLVLGYYFGTGDKPP